MVIGINFEVAAVVHYCLVLDKLADSNPHFVSLLAFANLRLKQLHVVVQNDKRLRLFIHYLGICIITQLYLL